MKIDYTKHGHAISDFRCEDFILTKSNEGEDIETSSSILILVARALIHTGELDYNNVEFLFEGESIGYCDKYGKLSSYPIGFCDIFDDTLDVILGWNTITNKEVDN